MDFKRKKAFSILELIVVISILGLLSAIAVPKLFDFKGAALASTIQQDVHTITNAIQSYNSLEGQVSDINKTVKINQNNWDVTAQKAIFSHEEESCVTIEVSSGTLTVTIDASSSDLCQDIYDNGVRSTTYDLF